MRRARALLHHCACCHDRSSLDRRACIGRGLAAVGVAGRGALAPASAQDAGSARPHRIAVDHHFAVPQWIAEEEGGGLRQRANVNAAPAKSIEDMDQGGVAAAMISIANRGLWFGDKDVTSRIARERNEY